jgi:hypothetical protein
VQSFCRNAQPKLEDRAHETFIRHSRDGRCRNAGGLGARVKRARTTRPNRSADRRKSWVQPPISRGSSGSVRRLARR